VSSEQPLPNPRITLKMAAACKLEDFFMVAPHE
jgi:hypothetical protein